MTSPIAVLDGTFPRLAAAAPARMRRRAVLLGSKVKSIFFFFLKFVMQLPREFNNTSGRREVELNHTKPSPQVRQPIDF